MPMITKIEQGGTTYDIGIPSGLSEAQQAQIRENIGAVSEGSTVVQDGTYPEMSVGKATNDSDGNNITETYVKLSDLDRLMLELEYPVGGKPYLQYPGMPTPAEKYAGTNWELDAQYEGRMLIGSGGQYMFETTGGSADAVVVEHNHTEFGTNTDGNEPYRMAVKGNNNEYGIAYQPDFVLRGNWVKTANTGEDGTGKNMPPYLVINYWKRIALEETESE